MSSARKFGVIIVFMLGYCVVVVSLGRLVTVLKSTDALNTDITYELSYYRMRILIRKTRHLLWVSGVGAWDVSPDHGLLDGLARALRAEYYELHLVTLVLNIAEKNNKVPLVMHIVKEMATRRVNEPYEQEYLEIGGYLQTRRLVEANDLKSTMDVKLAPYEVAKIPLDGKCQFKLSTSAFDLKAAPFFIQSEVPLPPKIWCDDGVNIMVKAVSIQSQNQAAALGQDGNANTPTYYYCSGVVLEPIPGSKSTLRPGDRVVTSCNGAIHSHISSSTRDIAKLPEGLSFTDACAASPYSVTVYQALVEIGCVKKSDSVLIYNGSAALGQAALRLLSDRGVRDVWTTATDREDCAWISEHAGISEDHILPDKWFESQPMVLSQWEPKFDIVLRPDFESPSPLLVNHVKLGGHFISIRTGSILQHNNQHIHGPPPGLSITTLHMNHSRKESIASSQSLQYAVSLSGGSTMDGQSHVSVFRASEIAQAFKHVQKADDGVAVIEFNDKDIVHVRTTVKPSYSLSCDASYLIVGGLGGIGRAMARWLVTRGASHLILLSRSGPKTSGALQLLSELQMKGVRVETPLCDELIFEKMTFSDWKATLAPKVQGSWNLHNLLPKDLDFFILISSMMGTIGGVSLSAYSAANSYMDALARYRMSRGERAAALGLGIVPDGGYLTEHTDRLAGVEGVEKYAFTRLRDIYALLEIYCDPTQHLSCNPASCQPVLGIRPPAHWSHVEEVPAIFSQPIWGHMHHVPMPAFGSHSPGEDEVNAIRARRKRALNAAQKLTAASSLAEAAEIATQALTQRTLALLGIAEDRLDPQKPMLSYGVDSLSAVDIRNWVGQVFRVDLPVFEILGGSTLASIGFSIARKAHLKSVE
ncbi:hypothetical protein Hte_011108 [Hypoxylon texense]